ncbi:MAG: polyamine-transporting ATPase [Acidimicrobiia bacterium]|nr:MAG: polyamine-transporting ATPase [Acidimicrobiia bacterium]
MPELVHIAKVTKRFGDVTAVDAVDLTIEENEFFALLGPSGCGKTTLLRILAGFEDPDEGQVLLGGRDLVGVRPYDRPVNMMFQSYALFPHLTVWQNIAYGLVEERLPKREIEQRVGEVIAKVGLEGLESRKPHQISGGQKQRVALARAIVKRPRVLLLDEPLAALDKKIRADMQLELKRLQHEVGITFVVVTHDQEEAMSMADRVAVMNQGRILQVADPITLYERPADYFVAQFIGEMNFIAGEVRDGRFFSPELEGVPAPDADAGPVWLALRPEKIVLRESPGATPVELEGRVETTTFFGSLTHCYVRLPGREEPVVVTAPGPRTFQPGATVWMTWRPEDAVLLPR